MIAESKPKRVAKVPIAAAAKFLCVPLSDFRKKYIESGRIKLVTTGYQHLCYLDEIQNLKKELQLVRYGHE